MNTNKDIYKSSRILYIIEAALEYFVAISVGTVYLARITTQIGMPDSLTGILSSFVSLGCGFQLIAIFLVNKRPVKRWVTIGHIVSQIMFSVLYFIPLFNLSPIQKTVIFVCMLLAAHVIHNVINAPKINWYMSLVDDDKRGKFTADKEIVSLIGGIIFSYGLGFVMDFFEAKGDVTTAFVACGIGLFVLMLLHSLTLIFSKEKEVAAPVVSVGENVKNLLKNKTLFKIIGITVIWIVANYATLSFTGTYQAKELGFSATYSSIIIMAGSLLRAIVSRPLGQFADKFSFRRAIAVGFAVEAVAYGINIFTSPANGAWLYFIYYLLYCVGMASINGATINLIYDYVEPNQRTGALALQQTISGVAGFLVTLILSPVVAFIQAGNFPFYAQQVTSCVSFVVVVIGFIYINTVLKKLKKRTPETVSSDAQENS